ncbi:MAG: hypothetical protein HQ546_01480 [Planctomycetes bacterium]|nr:hypothetical protein [Planctomycetota bacterium]
MTLLESHFKTVPFRQRANHRLHLLGNGHMLVIAEGGRILGITGPSYSFTNYVRLDEIRLDEQAPTLTAQRISQTGFWLYQASGLQCLDFLPEGQAAFCRRIAVSHHRRVTICLRCPSFIEITPMSLPPGALMAAPADVNMYAFGGRIPVPAWAGLAMVGGKNVKVTIGQTNRAYYQGEEVNDLFCAFQPRFWNLPSKSIVVEADASPGQDLALWVVAALTQPEATERLNEVTAQDLDDIQRQAFDAQLRWFEGLHIPENASPEARLTLESSAVALRVQTGHEGGVIAGHKFPLCYPQDMNFVMYGLLAMKQHAAARGIIEHLIHKFDHFGCTCNADDLGLDVIRNPYENEDVFIPADELFMLKMYAQATDDWDTLRRAWPWAQSSYRRQVWAMTGRRWQLDPMRAKQRFFFHAIGRWMTVGEARAIAECVGREGVGILGGDLFPFHGDETERWSLIKGSDVPNMMDASVESSLFFIAGARFYAQMARRFGQPGEAEQALELTARAGRAMETAFWRGNHFVANLLVPEHDMPGQRVGSCHMCNQFVPLQRKGRDYFCEKCFKESDPTMKYRDHRERVNVASALRPAYTGYFGKGDPRLKSTLDFVLANFRSPDTGLLATNERVSHVAGHVIGMALTAATTAGDPRAGQLYEAIIANVGSQWTYPEFYDPQGVPYGCQLRPMESGGNIGAIVHYLDAVGKP